VSVTSQSLWSSGPEPALLVSRDRSSGEIVFPPVHHASPLAARHELIPIAPDGVVYSYSVIHPNPKSGHPPYALGYVDLRGPVRIFGRIEGADRPTIGARCRARPDADFGYVFELTAQGEQA
jgi:uncharacterized OB-fold protein